MKELDKETSKQFNITSTAVDTYIKSGKLYNRLYLYNKSKLNPYFYNDK